VIVLISDICDNVYVCLCVHTLKQKRLKLSTHIVNGRIVACIESEIKRSRSRGYEVCCGQCGYAC